MRTQPHAEGRWRRTALLLAVALAWVPCSAGAAGLFFDDFSHHSPAALQAAGWTLRSKPGHPGVPGAAWSAEGLSLVAAPDAGAKSNRLLRLDAATNGTAPGTQQAQLCHARKFWRGTYAARVRFQDAPVSGAAGDPVVMAFYAVSPLAHDLDPQFSEIDFEYLPHGGWGSAKTRLYGISWHTVQIEPWRAFNQAGEAFGSHDGWRLLTMEVTDTTVRHRVDGRLINEARGRHVPVAPMALAFSLWFSPGGLLPASNEPRRYRMEVDWVLHAAGRVLSPAQVQAEVRRLRAAGTAFTDSVPASGLASGCDL